MAERSGTLGRVVVRGEEIEVHLEERPEFVVPRGDKLALALLYEFVDTPDEKEQTFLRLDVTLAGQRIGSAEARITDMPVRNDSHRGALSLTARVPSGGGEGVFRLEVRQELSGWNDKEMPHRTSRIESGTFYVKVA